MQLVINTLIEKWGFRQAVKFFTWAFPIIGVSTDHINSVTAVLIAFALWLVEMLFSRLNLKRIEKQPAR